MKWGSLTVGDAGEVARFESYVVIGPGALDCDIWTGALGDDGYGRFWIRRDGRQRVVRPHRYALALHVGPVPDNLVAMHGRCDNPICVRAVGRHGGPAHLTLGTQSMNLAAMGAKGRGGGGLPDWQRHGLTRAERVTRSKALREAVRHGWDAEAVRRALLDTSTPSLFGPEAWA